MDPTLIAAGVGAVGSLFGGNDEPQMPQQYGWSLDIQKQMLQRLMRRLRKPAGADAATRSLMATNAGMVNQNLNTGMASLQAQMGPNNPNGADAMANLMRSSMAQANAGNAGILRQAQSNRAQLPMQILQGAGQLAGSAAAGRYQPTQPDIGGGLAQIAYSAAQRRAAGGGGSLSPTGQAAQNGSGMGVFTPQPDSGMDYPNGVGPMADQRPLINLNSLLPNRFG